MQVKRRRLEVEKDRERERCLQLQLAEEYAACKDDEKKRKDLLLMIQLSQRRVDSMPQEASYDEVRASAMSTRKMADSGWEYNTSGFRITVTEPSFGLEIKNHMNWKSDVAESHSSHQAAVAKYFEQFPSIYFENLQAEEMCIQIGAIHVTGRGEYRLNGIPLEIKLPQSASAWNEKSPSPKTVWQAAAQALAFCSTDINPDSRMAIISDLDSRGFVVHLHLSTQQITLERYDNLAALWEMVALRKATMKANADIPVVWETDDPDPIADFEDVETQRLLALQTAARMGLMESCHWEDRTITCK